MKPTLKRALITATALLLAGRPASAQEISTSLPLTSIGTQLLWSVGDQALQLNVAASGRVRLELYSPRVDPKDYRSDRYYGDETYDPTPVSTTFTLRTADGQVVLTRTFTPGPAAWEPLLDQNLPAGQYQLDVTTEGNGKNTFAVRLAGVSAELSAERLNVNVHSQEWTPVLNVTTDDSPYVLRMYDGDGSRELEGRLRDAAGKIYPLAVSGDKTWSDLPLPAAAGNYTVELRQLPSAQQFSNTVSFTLTRQGNSTPLTIAKVDQTGLLRITAELLLPTGTLPTQADLLVGGQPLSVDGQLEKTVPVGNYLVNAAEVPGAEVQLDQPSVTVPKDGVGEVKVQVRPQVHLSLTGDKPEVCVGDSITLTARASTSYSGPLPMQLSLATPGLQLTGSPEASGTLSADQSGVLQVSGVATQPGLLSVTARLAPWNQEQTVQLLVRPDVTSLQLSREPLSQASVGDTVTVSLLLRNTASVPVPYTLEDQPGSGLKALEPTNFNGTLAPGEVRQLRYRALVVDTGSRSALEVPLNATLNTPACPAPQQVQGTLTVKPPAPRPAPDELRRSTVSLPFDAPRESRTVTVAHSIPAGATYVKGSSKLDGQPLPDPLRGPSGTLYWVFPAPTGNGTETGAALRGKLTYGLNHSGPLGSLEPPSLSVTYSANRSEILQGHLDTPDFSQAKPYTTNQATQTENPGAIKLPLQGAVIRIRDRISVTVEAPLGPLPTLSVNGQAVSQDLIGSNTQDSTHGIQRLTFVGVPLREGTNTLNFMGQDIQVIRAGATARVEVIPLSITADGSTPIRLKLRALDAQGQSTLQDYLTLSSNLEPLTPDAQPVMGGYQIKLVDGEGILEMQPQAAPTALTLKVLQGLVAKTYTFDITPDPARVGVGLFSVTAGLNGTSSLQDNLSWKAQGYLETPLAGGKLYIVGDKDKLPTDENTLIRYPAYGDASTERVPLQGIDPVAFTYDHPAFRADYRYNAMPVDVLPLGEKFTALTAYSKTNPQVSGFIAAVPSDLIQNTPITPDGTRTLHLPDSNISEGSETLVLATLERTTGKLLRTTTLVRNVDYVLDSPTGVVILTRAIDRLDAQLNEQRLYATYRLNDPLGNRQLAYGAQVKVHGQNYSAGVAAVSLDNILTFGARATFDDGTTKAEALVAYSGGLQASATLSGQPNDRLVYGVRARYQQPEYVGLGRFSAGTYLGADATFKVTDRLSVIGQAEYHDVPSSSVNTDPLTNLSQPDTKQGGSVSARAEYGLNPFRLGLGAKYAFGDISGFGLIGSVGYHTDQINADIVHTQPLDGGVGGLRPTTEITSRFSVARNVTLGFTDKITWGVGQAAILAVDSMIENVNYAIGYELPTASGAGNRARFGVSTTLPLNDRLALGVRGSALYDFARHQPEVGAGADLKYHTDTISASVGGDVSYNDKGFGVVVRAGITGSVNEHLTLTADGLAEYGQGKDGQRFSVGYAYRDRTFASLGYARYRSGTLASNTPELTTGASAEYRQPTWAVRGGFDTRTLLLDRSSYTMQAYLGGTAYLNEWIGLGVWGRAVSQPASQYSAYGLGLEGSLRVLPGTWLTAGYNVLGFDGLPSAYTYTKPGAYLRLDVTFDDLLLGAK